MSASPVARQVTQSQAIPRRVTITSANQLPSDYSTTPGGTIYSTTPGGTRIVYERAFLMQLRNSPLAKTPPKGVSMIPGLSPISPSKLTQDNNSGNSKQTNKPNNNFPSSSSSSPPPPPQQQQSQNNNPTTTTTANNDEQFEMDL